MSDLRFAIYDSRARRVVWALAVAMLLLGAVCELRAAQELQQANRIDCSFGPQTNWLVFTNQYSIVYSVEMDNFSGADIYLYIADAATNSLNGATGTVSTVKILNGTTGGKVWGPTGAPFQNLNVAASTTPYRLTNLAVNVGVITVTRRKNSP